MGDRILMSDRDRDVLKVMAPVLTGDRTQVEAARLLGKSVRQVRRLQRRLELEGDGGVVHRLCGRLSNRSFGESVRKRALSAYRRRYWDFGPTLASEKLSSEEGLEVSPDTLRRWLLSAGLWEPSRRRAKHRSRRPRRECFGELVQLDASIHEWTEGRGEPMALLALIDDATSRIHARFHPAETLAGYFELVDFWLGKHGRPVAFYSDQKSVFRSPTKEEHRRALTQFGRACGELEIELILAGSPQAKGRVERFFGTAQDRWVKEMRLAKVRTIAEANALVAGKLEGEFNRRFTCAPTSKNDAHRLLGRKRDRKAILCVHHERRVGNDYCIRFANESYQLLPPALPGLRGGKVTLELRRNGELAIRFGDRYLKYEALGALPPDPRSLAQAQHPAVGSGKQADRADRSARSSAVTLTDGRSGCTPAEPCPSVGKGKVKGMSIRRPPAPNHPWRQSKKRT